MDFRWFFFLGSFFSGLSVVLGAFLAHGLKSKVSAYELNIFDTATRYQMYHGLALLMLAFLVKSQPTFLLQVVGILFCLGVFIFSGSLYLLVFTKVKLWGAVTPVGGLFLIIAWFLLSYASFKLYS